MPCRTIKVKACRCGRTRQSGQSSAAVEQLQHDNDRGLAWHARNMLQVQHKTGRGRCIRLKQSVIPSCPPRTPVRPASSPRRKE